METKKIQQQTDYLNFWKNHDSHFKIIHILWLIVLQTNGIRTVQPPRNYINEFCIVLTQDTL